MKRETKKTKWKEKKEMIQSEKGMIKALVGRYS